MSGHTPVAVVTDARLKIAVTIARSLGKAGIPVVAAEAMDVKRPPAFYSKYTKGRVRLGPGAQSRLSDGDLEILLGAPRGPSATPAVIIPTFTSAVFKISADREKVGSRALTLVPELSSLRVAHDKSECYRLARRMGIPLPFSRSPSDESVDTADETALRHWAGQLKYPVILKYRSGEDVGLPASKRYRICGDPAAFASAYLQMNAVQSAPLAQEYIEGEDIGAAFLYNSSSRLVASFTYRSIRERPKGAGPTVFAISESHPATVEYGHKILSALRWSGMAMIDFRRGLDGQYRLLEINPRFWGSLALGVYSGVDFPLLYYRCCLGEEPDPVRQRDGVRVRFFPGDILSLFEYAKSRPQAGTAGGIRYALSESFRLLSPSVRDGFYSISDPKPGLVHLAGGVVSRHAGY